MRAIIAADLHLRADKPRCRMDEDWFVTQANGLRQLVTYANNVEACLCIVGDIFHTAVVPPKIKNLFLKYVRKVRKGVYILAGNHDLPYHSWKKVDDSSFGVIWNSGAVRSLAELGDAYHFGEKTEEKYPPNDILFIHTLVFPSAKDMPPNAGGLTAAELLDQNPHYKWIFTGDYHQGFCYTKETDGERRYVINPGCILRQVADLKEYKPLAFLVDTDIDLINPCYIMDEYGMVTDNYLRVEEQRKERISAFVETIKTSGPIDLDFLANLEAAMDSLECTADVRQMVELLIVEADTKK